MKITSALAGIAVAIAYFVLSASPLLGDDTGTINAQVKVGAPCLTLSTTAVDFGTIRFATNDPSATSGNSSPMYTVTNCGAASETLYVKGTDATSTTSSVKWSLVDNIGPCAKGPNYFGLRAVEQFVGGGYVDLSTSAQALPTVMPGGATRSHYIGFSWPCVGSGGAGETMTFQIGYTAAF